MANNQVYETGKAAFSIDVFCLRNSISRRTFYNLLEQGLGPRVMKLHGRVLVSAEAEADWHRAREEETAAASAPPAKPTIRRRGTASEPADAA
jgi:hypothetical protein